MLRTQKKGWVEGFLKPAGIGVLFLMLIPWCLGIWSTACGAEFPSKSIQIIVPYNPGGPSDITPRILSKRLSEVFGQQVVVVNKAGGGTAIGSQAVLTAPADGYTILSGELSLIMLPLLNKGVGFTIQDFTPINLSTSAPLCMIVNKDAPWKSIEDVVAEAKKRPDTLTYSTAGPGSIARFAGELFQMNTGTKITQIPMNGAPPAVTAVLGGQVNLSFMGAQVIKPHIEAGSLRGLAVLSHERFEGYPDMPSIAEKGYPKLTATVWTVFLVSKKTPPEIVRKLGAVFQEVYKEKEIRELTARAGLHIENLGPEEAKKFVDAEQKKWSEVAKAANIVPQ
jgi:tripartite-type tricarboxylate transporter receptor subunit TctC